MVSSSTRLSFALRLPASGKSPERVADTLTDAGVPAGLVNSISEAFAFAEGLGGAPVVELVSAGDPRRISRQVANPIHLGARPADYRLPPPRLGEHAGADCLEPGGRGGPGAAAAADPAPASAPVPASRPTPAPPTALRRTDQDLS